MLRAESIPRRHSRIVRSKHLDDPSSDVLDVEPVPLHRDQSLQIHDTSTSLVARGMPYWP